jgi:hypothetical protein
MGGVTIIHGFGGESALALEGVKHKGRSGPARGTESVMQGTAHAESLRREDGKRATCSITDAGRTSDPNIFLDGRRGSCRCRWENKKPTASGVTSDAHPAATCHGISRPRYREITNHRAHATPARPSFATLVSGWTSQMAMGRRIGRWWHSIVSAYDATTPPLPRYITYPPQIELEKQSVVQVIQAARKTAFQGNCRQSSSHMAEPPVC